MDSSTKVVPINKLPPLAWILVVLIIGDVFSAVLLMSVNPRWQTYLYLASSLFAAGMITIMVVFLKRGDYNRAGLIVLLEQSIRGLISAFVYKDLGIPMQLLTLVISAIIVLEWMPSIYLRRTLPYVLVVSLVMLFWDILDPSWRIEGSIPSEYRFIIVGFLILVFTVYATANFKSYRLMVKLVLILLGLTTVTIVSVSITANSIASKSAVTFQTDNLQSSVQDLGKSFDAFLDFALDSIETDAEIPEFKLILSEAGETQFDPVLLSRAANVLLNLTKRDPIFIESYSLLDTSGEVVLETSTVQAGETEKILVVESGSPKISPISTTSNSQGDFTISAPIYETDHTLIGALQVRYNAQILQNLVLQTNYQGGSQVFGILIDDQNVIWAHSADGGLIQTPFDYRLTSKEINRPNGSIDILEGLIPLSNFDTEGYGSIYSLKNVPWKAAVFETKELYLRSINRQTNVLILLAESIAVIVVIIGLIGARTMTAPLLQLTETAQEIAAGNLQAKSHITSEDEFGLLALALNKMSNQLYATRSSLEKRIKDRTQVIETAAQVSRVLSLTLETSSLVQLVANEIQKAFMYYHVQIFLIDPQEKNVVMVGGTGEIADLLIQQSFAVPFGKGPVGLAALKGTPVLISNTALDEKWLPNPLLPETRSELAVPIMLGGDTLGVLDVQHTNHNGLGEQDEILLELIAGQVAISLRNARQYERAREKLALQEKITTLSKKVNATTSVEEAIEVVLKELALQSGEVRVALKWSI